jgi:purine nucleosidase
MSFPVLSPELHLQRLAPPAGRVPMLLDTDPYNEIDDQFAITYALLSSDKLDVKAIHAAPFANSRSGFDPGVGMAKSVEVANEIVTRLDEIEGIAPPPVYAGADQWMAADDAGFAGSMILSDSVHNLIALANAQPEGEPLYVVAIGAITNVASAILYQPEIIEKIVVVWLGGHPATWHDTAEFNLQQDIFASRVVLDCGVPLVRMPCINVAEHLLLTGDDVQNRVAGCGSIGKYLHEEFEIYGKETQSLARPIWDMAPLAWLINPAWVPTTILPTPILATSPLRGAPYSAPYLSRAIAVDGSRRAHCTWANAPQRHPCREAYRIQRDAIFADFFAKLEQSK